MCYFGKSEKNQNGKTFFLFILCLQISPGEVLRLSIPGYDELNHTILTSASLTELSSFGIGQNYRYLSNPVVLLSPLDDGSFNFSYQLANETAYKEMEKYNYTVHHFHLEKIHSVFRNRFTFSVTFIPCRAGFKFVHTKCDCDKTIEGVSR